MRRDDERDWALALGAIELDLHGGMADLTDRVLSWTVPVGLGPIPPHERDRAERVMEQIRAAEKSLVERQSQVRRDLDDLVRRHPVGRDRAEPVAPRALDTSA